MSYRPIAGALFLILSVTASAQERRPEIPDLSGLWGRSSIPYEMPSTGPGPLQRLPSPPGARGRNTQVGDYTNPILTPRTAQIVREFGERAQTVGVSDAETECWPESPPYIYRVQETEIIQKANEILILYSYSNQIRRIRLNSEHPAHVTPSWKGDSVGHFEGHTLVVDTIGIKSGPYSMVDRYGTPYSEKLHLIERFHLIPHDEAETAMVQNEREYGRVQVGYAVDPNYKGPGLQLQFTVEDPETFAGLWSGVVTYRRDIGPWPERVCAENLHNFGAAPDPQVPSQKPDF